MEEFQFWIPALLTFALIALTFVLQINGLLDKWYGFTYDIPEATTEDVIGEAELIREREIEAATQRAEEKLAKRKELKEALKAAELIRRAEVKQVLSKLKENGAFRAEKKKISIPKEVWNGVDLEGIFSTDLETVKKCLAAAPDGKWLRGLRNSRGQTPLVAAIQYGALPIVKAMLRHTDKDGYCIIDPIERSDGPGSETWPRPFLPIQHAIDCYIDDWSGAHGHLVESANAFRFQVFTEVLFAMKLLGKPCGHENLIISRLFEERFFIQNENEELGLIQN